MTAAFALAGLGALVWLAVLLVLLRVTTWSPALIAVGFAIVVYVGVLAASLAAAVDLAFWQFSAAYGFATLCALMLFGALYKSVSLRVLGDLSKVPGHGVPEQLLLARYIEQDSFDRRVQILLDQGLAERAAGGLRPSIKGRRIAACIDLLQRAFAIRASG